MLYIILPVHNRKETTALFIECLKKQSYKDFHLVLIDDGSTDGTSELVQKEIEQCTVIKGKGNWWWAGSIQQGLNWIKRKQCNHDDILFINDDVVFESDFLENGARLLSKSKRSIFLAKSFSQQTKKLVDHGVTITWNPLKFQQANSVEEINCFSTRGLFAHINDVLEIGKLHPLILPHYMADYEFTYRAYKKGFQLSTDDTLWLYKNEETTGYAGVKYSSLIDIWQKYFSKKNPINIVYYTNFIVLAGFPNHIINELATLYAVQLRLFFKNYKKLVK
jgi:GT2 family glycosyltransferase